MNEQQTEQAIIDAGKTAHRITPADLDAAIASLHFFTAAQGAAFAVDRAMVDRFLTWPVPADVYPDGTPGEPGRTGTNLLTASQAEAMLGHVVQCPEAPSLALLTFCVIVLRNGFTVTGESACASPENFDPKIGQDIAYRNAREKLWPLLGYQLKDRLHRQAQYGQQDAL